MSKLAGEARSIGPIDVLVVDDESDMLDELTDALSRAHLTCNSAGDGWGALKLLADGWRPAVVVSDLHMPELNGLEFAGHINALPDRERPEIIFVSGAAGFDDAVQAIRLGARDLLTKPIDGPRLIRAVKSALLEPPGAPARNPGRCHDEKQEGGASPRIKSAATPARDARRPAGGAQGEGPSFSDRAFFRPVLGNAARSLRRPAR